MARNSIPIDSYRLRKAESMSTRHAYCKVCALSGRFVRKDINEKKDKGRRGMYEKARRGKTREGEEWMRGKTSE